MNNGLFYGWWVLLCSFLIFSAVSIGSNTLPLLNLQLKEEFKWTHEQAASAPSLFYLLAAFIAPLAGWMLDKFHPKKVILLGCILFISALFVYSTIQSLWTFLFTYLLLAAATILCGQVAGVYLLTNWFEKYRGLAIGLYFVGSSFGGIVYPQIAGRLIKSDGWQTAAFSLALIAAVFMFIPLFFVKNRPEEMGLYPDGKNQESFDGKFSPEQKPPFNLTKVILSFDFILVLFITAALCFCIYSLVQHLSYFLKDLKIDPMQSANILSLFFVCSIVGKVIFGYLGDQYSKKNIMLLATLNMCLGPFLLYLSVKQSTFFLFMAIVVYGIGYSGTLTMIQLLLATYYQGPGFGTILGIVTTFDTLAGSFGIYLLGKMRTIYGSYVPAFYLMLSICLLSALCVFLLKSTAHSGKLKSSS